MSIAGDAGKQQYYALKSKTTRQKRNDQFDIGEEQQQKKMHTTYEDIMQYRFPDMEYEFAWDPEVSSKEITFSPDCRHAFLYETNYYFRTTIANRPFFGGIHYWEIIADARTEHELKIGVTA